MIRRWAELEEKEKAGMLDIITERERLYCLLRQTGPRELRNNWDSWNIRPSSRYLPREVTVNTSYVASLHRDTYGNPEQT